MNDKTMVCIVCGVPVSKYSFEPRFGYYVCKKHEHIPPAEIHKYRKYTNEKS